MANEEVIHTVIVNNQTIMTVSDTTATANDVEIGKEFYNKHGQKVSGVGNRRVTVVDGEPDTKPEETKHPDPKPGDIYIIKNGDLAKKRGYERTFSSRFNIILGSDSENMTRGIWKREDDEPIFWHDIETIKHDATIVNDDGEAEKDQPTINFTWDNGVNELVNKDVYYRFKYDGEEQKDIYLIFTNKTGKNVKFKSLTVSGNTTTPYYYNTYIYSQEIIKPTDEKSNQPTLGNGGWIKLTDYTVFENVVNQFDEKLDLAGEQLTTLINEDSRKSVRDIAQEVAQKVSDSAIKALIDEAPEAFDTLKEIANWIGTDDGEQAAGAAQRLHNLETWRDGDDDNSGAEDRLAAIESWKDGNENYTGAENRLASVEDGLDYEVDLRDGQIAAISTIIGEGLENDDEVNPRNLTTAIIKIEKQLGSDDSKDSITGRVSDLEDWKDTTTFTGHKGQSFNEDKLGIENTIQKLINWVVDLRKQIWFNVNNETNSDKPQTVGDPLIDRMAANQADTLNNTKKIEALQDYHVLQVPEELKINATTPTYYKAQAIIYNNAISFLNSSDVVKIEVYTNGINKENNKQEIVCIITTDKFNIRTEYYMGCEDQANELAFYNWVNTNDDLTIGNLSCWKQESSSLGSGGLKLNTGNDNDQNRTVKSFDSLFDLTEWLITYPGSPVTALEWSPITDPENQTIVKGTITSHSVFTSNSFYYNNIMIQLPPINKGEEAYDLYIGYRKATDSSSELTQLGSYDKDTRIYTINSDNWWPTSNPWQYNYYFKIEPAGEADNFNQEIPDCLSEAGPIIYSGPAPQ